MNDDWVMKVKIGTFFANFKRVRKIQIYRNGAQKPNHEKFICRHFYAVALFCVISMNVRDLFSLKWKHNLNNSHRRALKWQKIRRKIRGKSGNCELLSKARQNISLVYSFVGGCNWKHVFPAQDFKFNGQKNVM